MVADAEVIMRSQMISMCDNLGSWALDATAGGVRCRTGGPVISKGMGKRAYSTQSSDGEVHGPVRRGRSPPVCVD